MRKGKKARKLEGWEGRLSSEVEIWKSEVGPGVVMLIA